MQCGHCFALDSVPGFICLTCESNVCPSCDSNAVAEKCPQLDPKSHELRKKIKVVDRDKSPERKKKKKTDKYKDKLKEIKEKRKENELLHFFKNILDDIHAYDYFSFCFNCDYPNVKDLVGCETCWEEYCDECIVWHNKLDAMK